MPIIYHGSCDPCCSVCGADWPEEDGPTNIAEFIGQAIEDAEEIGEDGVLPEDEE